MKEEDLDKIVLQYLKKRRFANAERLFKEEARLTGDVDMVGMDDSGLFEDLLLYNVADGDAKRFLEEFDRLAAWIDSSLDLYKGELSKVLWPAFLHSYLALVKRNATAEAHQLMTRHKERFNPAAGASQQHAQEARELAAVAVPQHLATSRVAQAAAGARTHIPLTAFSLELLVGFLHSARLTLLLSILNQHADFQVVEGPPAGGVQEGEDADMEAFVASQREVAPLNAAQLRLGILQGSVEDKYQTLKAQRAEAAAAEIPETDADGKPLTKKARAALQKAAEQAKAAQAGSAVDRIEAAVPLPPQPDDAEPAVLANLEAQAELSPTALPSCAFFTFVNTAQALNCAAFLSDSTRLAGGFADSSVRLYDLRRMSGGSSALEAEAGIGGNRGGDGGCVTLHGHSGPVFGVDASHDSRFLFSSSADGTVRLWSTELAANLAVFRGHLFPVWDCAACPGGQYLVSGSADRTARVWSTERPQALRLLVGHQADVDVVRWHPTCQYVVTGSSDRTVRMWDVTTAACVRIFLGQQAPITALEFSSDGKTLAVGCDDGSVSAWDVGEARRLGAAQHHTGPVWSLAISHGENALLASGGADNTVRLWNLKEAPSAATDGSAEVAPAQAKLALGVPGLLKTYQTKATPVFSLHFSQRNLLMGTGALTLPPARRKPAS